MLSLGAAVFSAPVNGNQTTRGQGIGTGNMSKISEVVGRRGLQSQIPQCGVPLLNSRISQNLWSGCNRNPSGRGGGFGGGFTTYSGVPNVPELKASPNGVRDCVEVDLREAGVLSKGRTCGTTGVRNIYISGVPGRSDGQRIFSGDCSSNAVVPLQVDHYARLDGVRQLNIDIRDRVNNNNQIIETSCRTNLYVSYGQQPRNPDSLGPEQGAEVGKWVGIIAPSVLYTIWWLVCVAKAYNAQQEGEQSCLVTLREGTWRSVSIPFEILNNIMKCCMRCPSNTAPVPPSQEGPAQAQPELRT